MDETRKKAFLLNAAFFAMLAAAAYLSLRYLLRWTLPFLLALLAAAAMEPAIRFLARRFHFRRSFSAAVLTLFLLFVLGGLLSLLLSALFREATGFLTQAASLLASLPALSGALTARLTEYCALCPVWMQELLSHLLSDWASCAGTALGDLASRLLSLLGTLAGGLPRLMLAAATTLLAVYFTSVSYPVLTQMFLSRLSERTLHRLRHLRRGAACSLVRWLRAQAILCALTFAQLFLGLSLLRAQYALLAAFLITLVDALPVFGTGTVLLPWALAEALLGSTPRAVALLLLYLVILLVRNIMEPKLMAAQAGVPPIASLAAMYLGWCALGVAGMLFAPFLLLLVMQLRQTSQKSAPDDPTG